MEHRRNWRRSDEYFVKNKHLRLEDLKAAAQDLIERNPTLKMRNYIFLEDIPAFPRPEFHVSYLQHDTDAAGLRGIKRDGGFKDPGNHRGRDYLQWWHLSVKPEDITSAERRLLEDTYPDRTEDQAQDQRSFLGRFASSPAFLKNSRLGSYRFTFPVEEVLKAYSQQFCSGAPPVMRVYETVLYKQEVMYVVLVHSPGVQKFICYPELSEDPEAVCCYRGGRFIWRSQAMCETHRYELVHRPDKNQMAYRNLYGESKTYVWDNVAVALHVEEGQVLKFDDDKLGKNLTYCHREVVSFRNIIFEGFEEARRVVEGLWSGAPLQKERPLQPLLTSVTQCDF